MSMISGWKIVALSLGALVSHAFAQVAGYEVIDLGTLPNSASPESSAWAINDRHEVVGWARDSNKTRHATLWLYCPNYGLVAREWHDLTAAAGESDDGEAFDMNMSGLVVGRQATSTSGGIWRGYLWDVAASPLSTVELETFISGANTQGFANAVNDASPAIIVGTAQASGGCLGSVSRNEAFSYRQGDPAWALTDLGANSSDYYSQATGVNNATPALATGRSTSELCYSDSCQSDQEAVGWTLTSPPMMADLPDNGLSYGAQAWGINDAGHRVGIAVTAASPCERHAAFWASSSTAPVDLGSVGIASSHGSIAYRLNEQGTSGEATVVGGDTSIGLAWRWYRNSAGTWSGVDLNSLISPLCGGWVLREAHDVSSDGWIVGYGSIGGQRHGFLLKPIECRGDLNGSCSVDGADLGLLLGAWGCSPCNGCMMDMNFDGAVNGADLGILLGGWGSCVCSGCQSGARSSESGAEASTPALDEALVILGLPSVAKLNQFLAAQGASERAETLDWLFVYLISRN